MPFRNKIFYLPRNTIVIENVYRIIKSVGDRYIVAFFNWYLIDSMRDLKLWIQCSLFYKLKLSRRFFRLLSIGNNYSVVFYFIFTGIILCGCLHSVHFCNFIYFSEVFLFRLDWFRYVYCSLYSTETVTITKSVI